MQRQFLYNFYSFLCSHENTHHGVPSNTIPGDKQSPVLAYRGKGLVFFIYCFLDLFVPEWKPDLLGRIRGLPEHR